MKPTEFTTVNKIEIVNIIRNKLRTHNSERYICLICKYDLKIINDTDSRLLKPIFPELYKVISDAQKRSKLRHKKEAPYYKVAGWIETWEGDLAKPRIAAMEKLKKGLIKESSK